MDYYGNSKNNKGQTAVEYIVLLTAVVAVVLIGFNAYIPTITNSSNTYFNRAAYGILGMPNRCGDGVRTRFETFDKCPIPGG